LRGRSPESARPALGGNGRRENPEPAAHAYENVFAGGLLLQVSTMILPQVHLRKPCYDFSFL
jgi:hypothetical protein